MALGRKPRCTLEVAGSGASRLDRIFELLAACAASVHDLSRVQLSGRERLPRFNMAFEMGLAFALTKAQPGHRFFLLEAKEHRLQKTLSDLNGYDPHIHYGRQAGVLGCLLDCFAVPAGSPTVPDLARLTRMLARVVRRLEREHGVEDPFRPHLYRRIVDAATALARAQGLLH